MAEADLRNHDGQALPVHAVPRVSGIRIALGVIIGLVTVALTLIMLVLTICGYLWDAGNHKDSSGVLFLEFLDIVVPVGGTCLVARLLRPSKKAVAAAAATSSLPSSAGAPSFAIQGSTTQEIKKRLMHLRIIILAAIAVHAAYLILNMHRNRTGNARSAVLSIAVYAIPLIPYVLVLLGITRQARPWPLALALMYAIISLCSSVFYFFVAVLWHFPSYRSPLGLEAVAYDTLGFALNAAIVVFAWRVGRATGRSGEDAPRWAVCGIASILYLFIVPALLGILLSMFGH
jgi:hypothetical protein